jgi:hypothetical protein
VHSKDHFRILPGNFSNVVMADCKDTMIDSMEKFMLREVYVPECANPKLKVANGQIQASFLSKGYVVL